MQLSHGLSEKGAGITLPNCKLLADMVRDVVTRKTVCWNQKGMIPPHIAAATEVAQPLILQVSKGREATVKLLICTNKDAEARSGTMHCIMHR